MSYENKSGNMNDDTLDAVHKAGSLLIIETGEYSDRTWNGPVRLLKDFTKREVIDRFKEEWKSENEWETPSPGDFMPWLIVEGYVEAVEDCTSWHVGSYGEFDPY